MGNAQPSCWSLAWAWLKILLLALPPWGIAACFIYLIPWTASANIVALSAFACVLLAAVAFEFVFTAAAKTAVEEHASAKLDDFHYDRLRREPGDESAKDAWKTLTDAKAPRNTYEQGEVEKKAVRAFSKAISANFGDIEKATTLTKMMEKISETIGWSPAEEDKLFDRLTYVLNRLQSRIGEEYTDVCSRTGWLMTSQAFLLASFVTVLNAERLGDQVKHWLATGIGISSAFITFLLALSIFYGHALIGKLKRPRDAAEKAAATLFFIPRASVRGTSNTHVVAHAATRFLPCFAYMVWICLTFFAFNYDVANSGSKTLWVLPPDSMTEIKRGWRTLESSPSFAIGAVTFDEKITGCPSPDITRQAAEDWVKKTADLWRNRGQASANDGLILIGGADRMSLNGLLKHQYDENVGLARSRADEVKRLLMKETKDDPSTNKITAERVIVLVTGPQYQSLTSGTSLCTDPALAADRKVQVWIRAGT